MIAIDGSPVIIGSIPSHAKSFYIQESQSHQNGRLHFVISVELGVVTDGVNNVPFVCNAGKILIGHLTIDSLDDAVTEQLDIRDSFARAYRGREEPSVKIHAWITTLPANRQQWFSHSCDVKRKRRIVSRDRESCEYRRCSFQTVFPEYFLARWHQSSRFGTDESGPQRSRTR